MMNAQRHTSHKKTDHTGPDHLLTVAEILGFLVSDGLVDPEEANALLAESRLKRLTEHPLVIIADQKWKSLRAPHVPLTLEALGEWNISTSIR